MVGKMLPSWVGCVPPKVWICVQHRQHRVAVLRRPISATVACVALVGCGRLGFETIHRTDNDADAGAGPGSGGEAGGRGGGDEAGSGGVAGRTGGSGAAGIAGSSGSGGNSGAAGDEPSGTSGACAACGTSGGGGAGGQGGKAGTGAVGPIDYCRELPALSEDPSIDGDIEPGLLLLPVAPVGWRGLHAIPDGYAMSYAAAWRPEGLYFFVQVQDPDRNPAVPADFVWMGDAVELYVDADGVYPPAFEGDDPGARQLTVSAPVDDTTPSTRGETYVVMAPGVAWDSSEFVAVPTPEGYDVEAFIVAADLGLSSWVLGASDRVGIDLGHDVSLAPGETGTDGNRDSQYFLHILEPPPGNGTEYPFLNENAYCTATLLAP